MVVVELHLDVEVDSGGDLLRRETRQAAVFFGRKRYDRRRRGGAARPRSGGRREDDAAVSLGVGREDRDDSFLAEEGVQGVASLDPADVVVLADLVGKNLLEPLTLLLVRGQARKRVLEGGTDEQVGGPGD